ncbi:hypothetical protein HHK36_006709 [Tetracentron sinense]|uniref:Uncharacterized protein n=1 Tax=Tetracentron sinense TaxID=13715 RepID=A0A834ZLE7_TETSI|nr:hypothetical protein HHK36_006709 [Tetracentron sinense]
MRLIINSSPLKTSMEILVGSSPKPTKFSLQLVHWRWFCLLCQAISEVEKLRGKEGTKVESAPNDISIEALLAYGRDLVKQAGKLDPLIGRENGIPRLRGVGAKTYEEYKKYKEKAFARRFQPVYVAKPNVVDTISILRGVKERYEEVLTSSVIIYTYIHSFSMAMKSAQQRTMEQEGADSTCTSCPLLNCIWDFLLLLLHSPSDFDPVVDSCKAQGNKEIDAATARIVAAQKHFQQVQHIRGV